jgi:hypothetical protein
MSRDINLILGTGHWLPDMGKQNFYKLLDTFYENGFKNIETATSYPLCGDMLYFRQTEKLISEWIKSNKTSNTKIIVRGGEMSNSLTHKKLNLTFSYILMLVDDYLNLFENNLDGFILAADDRSDRAEIIKTMEALIICREEYGLNIGLSKIKNPGLYFKILKELSFKPQIIVEDYFVSVTQDYKPFIKDDFEFVIDGFNLYKSVCTNKTGMLLNWCKDNNFGELTTAGHLNILFSCYSDSVSGYIINPPTDKELSENILLLSKFRLKDYNEVYNKLKRMLDD